MTDTELPSSQPSDSAVGEVHRAYRDFANAAKDRDAAGEREYAALRRAGVAIVGLIHSHNSTLAFLAAIGDVGDKFIKAALTACVPPCPLCLASDVGMRVESYRPPLAALCGRCATTFRIGADCRPDAIGIVTWQPLPDAGGHVGMPVAPRKRIAA